MVRVDWNRSVIDDVVERAQRKVATELSDEGAERAKDLAPILSGDYRSGIESDQTEGGTVGRIIGTHWSSHFIENGTPTNPPFAPLRNALAALGLRPR